MNLPAQSRQDKADEKDTLSIRWFLKVCLLWQHVVGMIKHLVACSGPYLPVVLHFLHPSAWIYGSREMLKRVWRRLVSREFRGVANGGVRKGEGTGKHNFSEGKHNFSEGKYHFSAGKYNFSEGKHNFSSREISGIFTAAFTE